LAQEDEEDKESGLCYYGDLDTTVCVVANFSVSWSRLYSIQGGLVP